MQKPQIFIAKPIPSEVREYLEQHATCTFWEKETPVPRQELREHVAQVEGLLTAGGKITSELLDAAPKLRVVSTMSVGYNHFDIPAFRKRGVIGTHTPGVLNDTVADLVMAMMLTAGRRISELDRYVKDGHWQRGDNESLFGLDIHHKILGIIGMGGIGKAVAKRAKFGFDMSILYHNRHRNPEVEQEFCASYCSLDELLQQSDLIVLMTPLTEETRHLIGAQQFAKMKKTAIFINASRGQTVDEQALIQALQTKQIYAAGLDVFEQEPVDRDNPLLSMPNVITLPHIGSATETTRDQMAMLAAQNLIAALQGLTPPNLIPELRS
ncbi:gluconate 2-dehydrogenase [Paenibacillus shirakamiensis]|uniref:Gluconate 2-dehydrogenase n=1 Tax=Paenibacillus shirakamiensis TaxID=1265935 RepID=A0ABS4JFM3_9BACL|nr:gluconate 2-dehydrogenase [Paenibacillus shirakamiensis]